MHRAEADELEEEPEPGTSPQDEDITLWLQQLATGAARAPAADSSLADVPPGTSANELFAALYGELKRQASAHMRQEHAGHTLSATALTHEAWFRLSEQTRTHWQGRSHFLGVASLMMRRILVNHALAKRAEKRDALLVSLTLTEAQQLGQDVPAEVVQVHDALLAFEAIDPRAAKVVELKFFGGLEVDEIAQVLGVSAPTVKRDWALARAWLHRELGGALNGAPALPAQPA